MRLRWWVGDPRVVVCDRCGCPIQQTPTGTLIDGVRAHNEYVHPVVTAGAV